MLNQHSIEEIAEIYSLLDDIKKEYEHGIKPVILKNSPDLFKNPHTVPKLKKIQINRGLGLSAQNTNILKKNILCAYFRYKKYYLFFLRLIYKIYFF